MIRERLTNNISIKNLAFLSGLMLGVAKTGVIGKFVHEKGHSWPLSSSFLLPILESVGKRKTPLELYPIVSLFYDYIRAADDLFDKEENLPIWEATKKSLKIIEEPLFERLEKSQIIDETNRRYIFERVNSLGTSVYETMQVKSQWTKTPSFEDAYSYRWETTALLSDVVADIWCIFAKVPEDLRVKTREITKRLGMLFQFRDDLMDLQEDGDMDGNLVLAVIDEENEKDSLFESIKNLKSKTNLIKLMKIYSPKSFNRIMNYMQKELELIQEQSPNTASELTGLMKLAIHRIAL